MNFSIKGRVITTTALSALIAAICAGAVAINNIESNAIDETTKVRLPEAAVAAQSTFDKEIDSLANAVTQLANNKYLMDDFNNGGIEETSHLVPMLNDIKAQYGLEDASYIWTKTNEYWNTSGLLKILNKTEDAWFFKTMDSPEKISLSTFTEKDGTTKFFVTVKSDKYPVVTATAKTMSDMQKELSKYKITKGSDVMLVNNTDGIVAISSNQKALNGRKLTNILSDKILLVETNGVQVYQSIQNGKDVYVATIGVSGSQFEFVVTTPIDEILAHAETAKMEVAGAISAVVILLTLLGFVVANRVVLPLVRISDVFNEIGQGDGDLNTRLTIEGKDEITRLSHGFNEFVEKIHKTVKEIASVTEQLKSASMGVDSQATSLKNSGEEQKVVASDCRDAIIVMEGTIADIANNAAQAAEKTSESTHLALSSIDNANLARESMSNLSCGIEKVATTVNELANSTESIGAVLDVIREISEQTNLLALNAAIEAARAGEHGRGFAVVADEVRGLAGRTNASIDSIQEMIVGLQKGARAAVSAIEENYKLTQEGVDRSIEGANAFEQIAIAIQEINEMNGHVASATVEQSGAAQDVSGKVMNIDELTRVSATSSIELNEASVKLNELASKLESTLNEFKY